MTRRSLWSLILPGLFVVCAQAQANSLATGALVVTTADSADLTIVGPIEDSALAAAQSAQGAQGAMGAMGAMGAIAYADGTATLSPARGMTSGEIDGAANSVNNPPTIIYTADTGEAPHRQAPGKDGQAGPVDDDIRAIATDDDRATAIAVTLGTPVSGAISPGGDVDFYSFTLASPSAVTIETTGATDTAGRLQNSAGSLVEFDSDDGTGSNFRIEWTLGAGAYFIRVSGQSSSVTGNYSLSVAATADSDFTRDGAIAVTVGTPASGAISPADVDFYRFTLASPSVVTIETTGATDTAGRLEDSAGNSLEFDDSDGAGNNFRIERVLGAGAYFVRVQGQGNNITGNYSLSVTGESATAVTLGTPASGAISPAGHVDLYSFTLASASAVTIETTGATDTAGQLQDSAGGLLEFDSDDGTGSNFRIEWTLGAGAYFIRVAGQSSSVTGNYSLSVAATADSDFTRDGATALTAGTPASDSISPVGDVDYYSFTLASPSVVTIATTGTTDTAGQLQDSAGTELESDSDDGTGNNFRIIRYLGAGAYYIRVAGQTATGAYSLSVTEESVIAVTAGTPASGGISAAGDADYYSLTLTSPSVVTIETAGATDTFGLLQDSAGTELASDDDGGTGVNFRIERALGAGVYYIRVAGWFSATGNYSLSVTAEDATAVTVGTPVSGALSAPAEVDYYSFTLASPSTVIIETTGATDTYGELQNSAGTELASDDGNGTGDNFRIESALGAGTYFISISGQSSSITGAYSLSVTATAIRLRLRLFLEGPLR